MELRNTYDTEDLWEKDRDHYIHPWSDFSVFHEEGSLVVAEADGVHVYDSDGKQYIDGIGGLWCVNIGYGSGEMADAIAEQVRAIPYYSVFSHITTPSAAQLASKLAEIAPGPLNHVFYVPAVPWQMIPLCGLFTTTTICAASSRRKKSFLAPMPITVVLIWRWH